MKCQAQVQDFANAQRYNLRRALLVADYKPCSRGAINRLGKLVLCRVHTKLALDGLIDESGQVEDRSVLRDVRRFPDKFPGGVHRWTRDLKPEPIDGTGKETTDDE